MMNESRALLRHFLAALAYRTQKALRDAPPEYAEFRAAPNVRTPHELLQHMTSVMGYARTFFRGGEWWPELVDAQLLQGPFADAIWFGSGPQES